MKLKIQRIENKLLLGILCLFIALHFVVACSDKLTISSDTIEVAGNVGEITREDEYRQEFVCEKDYLSQVKILIGTYDRTNHSNIEISLLDNAQVTIHTWNIDCSLVKDVAYYTLNLDSAVKDSFGKTYFLEIRSDAVGNEDGVTVFYGNREEREGFVHNGEKIEGTLCMQIVYHYPVTALFHGVNIIHSIILMILIVIAFFLVYRFRSTIKTEHLFLIIWICVSAMFFDSGTLFRVPDEFNHFFRSFEISEGYMISRYDEELAKGGRELPLEGANLEFLMNDWESFWENKSVPLSDFREFWDFSNTALYSPVSYLPQAAGIWIAKSLHAGVGEIAYAGRFVNWISITILLFLAVHLLPMGKGVLILVLLMPMNVYESCSLAPDGMVVAVSVFLISYVFYLRFEKRDRLRWYHLIILYVLAVCIALYKIVYLPFCLLYSLIPEESFGGKKGKYVHLFVMAMIAVGLELYWLKTCRVFLLTRGTDSSLQLLYICRHPINYMITMTRTVFMNAGFWVLSMIGYRLGGLNIAVTEALILPYFLLLGMQYRPARVMAARQKQSVYLLQFVLISVSLLTFTSLYLQWTPVYQNTIEGVQGRYFIPLLLPLYFAFYGNYDSKRNNYLSTNVLAFVICVNSCAAINVLFSCIRIPGL